MSSGITFTDYKGAKEYANQKEDEGYEVDICKSRQGTWKVTLLGKRTKSKEPRLELYYDVRGHTPSQVVAHLREDRVPPRRTSTDIKRIVSEEAGKANIDMSDTPTQIREEEDAPNAISGIIHGAPWSDEKTLYLHPLLLYTSETFLRESIQHEMKHLKKAQNDEPD